MHFGLRNIEANTRVKLALIWKEGGQAIVGIEIFFRFNDFLIQWPYNGGKGQLSDELHSKSTS